jgi:shikimate dehydrogenase
MTGDRLAGFLAGLDESWRGLSLTMPLKQDVIPLLTEADELSSLTGGANTVLIRSRADGSRSLSGFNTDVPGIVRALTAAGVSRANHVVLLGGGATASSALVAAAQMGAQGLTVLARSPQRASFLAGVAGKAGVSLSILPLAAESLLTLAADLVISTVPGEAAPTELLRGSRLARTSVLLDVAYHPWPSALAGLWNESDMLALSGLAMLVQQALIQIRIFVAGDPFAALPNEDAVLAAMQAAVGLDGRGLIPAS